MIQLYADLLRWDIEVMSQPWMYYWLLIPISVYIPFFLIKWMMLTAPIWIPLGLIRAAVSRK